MKIIEFNEIDQMYSILGYMLSNKAGEEKYKKLALNAKIQYKTEEINRISEIVLNYCGDYEIAKDTAVIQEILKIGAGKLTLEGINKSSNIFPYSEFIKKIEEKLNDKNNKEYKKLLIDNLDNKQAFMQYIGDNLKVLMNFDRSYRFIRWNGEQWELITEDEVKIIYNNFIEECKQELEQQELSESESALFKKKVFSWDNKNKVSEAIEKIKRDKNYVINAKDYIQDDNIIYTRNGKIIDLYKGKITDSCKEDISFNISNHKLVSKEKADKFMRKVLKIYESVLGKERTKCIVDIIAFKLLGKNLQKAIFLIGEGATGKSTLKNIMLDLFGDRMVNVPYQYLTKEHKGNCDKSRDDLLVSLDNKLLAAFSEGERELAINQAKFKMILSNSVETARPTGGGLVKINLKRLDLIVDTNVIPAFTDVDEAISRRLLFINFENKIPVEDRNPNYYTEEIIPNFDKVFSFFIYRALEIINTGLVIPKIVEDDTRMNIEHMDSLLKFATELLQYDAKSQVDCLLLEEEYNKFCRTKCLRNIVSDKISGTPKAFSIIGERLSTYKGYEQVSRDRVSDGKNRKKYVFKGVSLRNI